MEKMKAILETTEQHLFYKIAEFNKWNSIFPSDKELNNVKLNDELVDYIFIIQKAAPLRL